MLTQLLTYICSMFENLILHNFAARFPGNTNPGKLPNLNISAKIRKSQNCFGEPLLGPGGNSMMEKPDAKNILRLSL